MNYKKQYENLINTRKLLDRSKKNGIYEKHHIKPKCIRGSNKSENLILLTPKEHYIAHLLLTNIYTGKIKAKMCYAFMLMCVRNPNQKRNISAKKYESAKLLVSKNCTGKNASGYGQKLSDEIKKNISERMKGDKNPSRKYGVWNKGMKLPPQTKESNKKRRIAMTGQKRTEETKKKMSQSALGKSKSEEHRSKLSKANIGKKLSKETRKKMSISKKGIKQPIVICPHCNKTGGLTLMKRFHFDNCKLR